MLVNNTSFDAQEFGDSNHIKIIGKHRRMKFSRQTYCLKEYIDHLRKLFCTLPFEVTESDLHQQGVQNLSFLTVSGIFQIPSPFETTCSQNLANDFFALPWLYLAIADGPGHIRKIWDTLSKLQVCPGHVQIFEPFDWLRGYKIAFSHLYLVDL